MTMGKSHTSKRLVREEPMPGPGAYEKTSLILNENKVLSTEKKLAYGKLFFPANKS